MRIVQLVTRRQRRGGEVFAADLSTVLAERGHDVHYAGLVAPPAEPLTPAGVNHDDVSDATESVLSPRLVFDLARYLRLVQPDVIQANGGFAMKYAALAKRWGRGAWPILYCNIGLSSDWVRRPGQRLWNQWLLGHAAATAAVSATTRADLIATYGLDPNSVEVVRRGLRTEPVISREAGREALEAAGVPTGTPVILHVGSFSPEKNHEGLLRIHERVRGAAPNLDTHLVLVGGGPLKERIESRALGNVHLLGVRSDVAHLMAGADVLALPSLTEGIPGVVLEAAVQYTPTVAYDVGGVKEVVRDGFTGRLLDRNDEQGMATSILELLEDEEMRRELGRSARRLMCAAYSLSHSADAFERLYHEIMFIEKDT